MYLRDGNKYGFNLESLEAFVDSICDPKAPKDAHTTKSQVQHLNKANLPTILLRWDWDALAEILKVPEIPRLNKTPRVELEWTKAARAQYAQRFAKDIALWKGQAI